MICSFVFAEKLDGIIGQILHSADHLKDFNKLEIVAVALAISNFYISHHHEIDRQFAVKGPPLLS